MFKWLRQLFWSQKEAIRVSLNHKIENREGYETYLSAKKNGVKNVLIKYYKSDRSFFLEVDKLNAEKFERD